MPWLALAPRWMPPLRPRLRVVKAAPPPDWEALLALADAQAPTLARAFLAALTWEDLPNDVRQALLAGNGVQAAALLTLHVETQMNALYSPAVHQVAESLLRGVAIQQWETLRETLRGLEVPSPIPTKLPGDLLAPRAIDALYREGLRRVQGINTTTMEALRPPLMEGIAQGRTTPQIARELVPKIGLTTQQARALDTYAASVADLPQAKREARIERKAMQLRRKRAMTIALTESHAMMNTSVDEFFQQVSGAVGLAPSALKRFWLITEGSDRTCEYCKPIPGLNARGRDFGEAFQTPKGPQLRPPLHPRCVPGDTLVTPVGAITAVSKRWYEGEMLVLHTALKKQLSCTPNHPILTRHGWVAAGLLKPGCEVVCGGGNERIGVANQHIGDMPARIEEIAEAFRLAPGMASRKVPVAAEDFHGDGKGSKIAIIRTDGLLWDDGDLPLNQPLLDELFKGRALSHSLISLGNFHAVFQRLGFATDPQMCSRCLLLALLRGHLAPFQALGFALRPQRDAMLTQTSGDDDTFGVKLLRQRIDRHAVQIQRDDLFFRQGPAALGDTLGKIADYEDASGMQPIIDGVGTDAIVESHLLPRDSRLITCDQLVNIESNPFRGHVYNLQTEQGWYISNGIITHNCRCVVLIRPSVLVT